MKDKLKLLIDEWLFSKYGKITKEKLSKMLNIDLTIINELKSEINSYIKLKLIELNSNGRVFKLKNVKFISTDIAIEQYNFLHQPDDEPYIEPFKMSDPSPQIKYKMYKESIENKLDFYSTKKYIIPDVLVHIFTESYKFNPIKFKLK